MGRTLHKGLSAKLYLSMGGCGKVKLRTVLESFTSVPVLCLFKMSEWIHFSN